MDGELTFVYEVLVAFILNNLAVVDKAFGKLIPAAGRNEHHSWMISCHLHAHITSLHILNIKLVRQKTASYQPKSYRHASRYFEKPNVGDTNKPTMQNKLNVKCISTSNNNFSTWFIRKYPTQTKCQSHTNARNPRIVIANDKRNNGNPKQLRNRFHRL
jgi:hypothetical protein